MSEWRKGRTRSEMIAVAVLPEVHKQYEYLRGHYQATGLGFTRWLEKKITQEYRRLRRRVGAEEQEQEARYD